MKETDEYHSRHRQIYPEGYERGCHAHARGAREITGRNFFGIEEAIKHFGVDPSTQELAYLADIPFSEETLTACHYSHILIAVFPLSIIEIRDKVDHDVFYSREFPLTTESGTTHRRSPRIAERSAGTWFARMLRQTLLTRHGNSNNSYLFA